jgi:hypothetical protein
VFPARIPYGEGTVRFEGFQALITSYLIARSRDPYQGLWYTRLVVAVGLAVSLSDLPFGHTRDFGEDAT